jgi:argininosuccinate lyase
MTSTKAEGAGERSRLWESRFTEVITEDVLEYTQTVDVDERLVAPELWASMAHVLMLARQGIVEQAAAAELCGCLLDVWREWEAGEFVLDRTLEDVHLNIESTVIERLGLGVGGRLHTARSRNDQVVTDARIYLRDQLLSIGDALVEVAAIAAERAVNDSVMLGYTHSQAAQPISFGFWCGHCGSIAQRSLQRLEATYTLIDVCPLGAAALAGTSFDVDRRLTARLLGFGGMLEHAMDATTDREFVLDVLSFLAIGMTSQSRIWEELVTRTGLCDASFSLDDFLATGSSIMPQKKNPVVAELARGRAGTVIGALTEALAVFKGTSFGYSCDLQQDKPELWRALDVTQTSTELLAVHLRSLQIEPERALAQCWQSFSTATELANSLVEVEDFSFRRAYQVVGGIVRDLIGEGETLRNLERVSQLLEDQDISRSIENLAEIIDPRAVVARQTSLGATGPEATRNFAEQLARLIEERRAWLAEKREQLDTAREATIRAAEQMAETGELPTALGEVLL